MLASTTLPSHCDESMNEISVAKRLFYPGSNLNSLRRVTAYRVYRNEKPRADFFDRIVSLAQALSPQKKVAHSPEPVWQSARSGRCSI
jgi:hypothetical protein